jgi:hypothetical protein
VHGTTKPRPTNWKENRKKNKFPKTPEVQRMNLSSILPTYNIIPICGKCHRTRPPPSRETGFVSFLIRCSNFLITSAAQNKNRFLISSKQNINHRSALIPFPELYNLIHFQLQTKVYYNSRIIMALPKIFVNKFIGHPELKTYRRSKIVNLKMFFFFLQKIKSR